MAIVTRDEILNSIKENFEDRLEDEKVISLIENISDTMDDYVSKASTDWKQKYEENDKAWKKKYTDRFFHKPVDENEDEQNDNDNVEQEEPKKKYTFDELFNEQ